MINSDVKKIPVHFIDGFPATIKGACTYDSDTNEYDIFISADIDKDSQLEALAHEYEHLLQDDFSKDSISKIESERHAIISEKALMLAQEYMQCK